MYELSVLYKTRFFVVNAKNGDGVEVLFLEANKELRKMMQKKELSTLIQEECCICNIF